MDKTIQAKQIGSSTWHSNEAQDLIEFATQAGLTTDTGIANIEVAKVHAQLATAAAIRAGISL